MLRKETMANYTEQYLEEVVAITQKLDPLEIENIVDSLVKIREHEGRLFMIGVGGGAGNASHAVCDARKTAAIESYTPTDNVSELTARINDDGWETCYTNWLKASHLNPKDAIFVFSVGGGTKEISTNLVDALKFARKTGATILGIVGVGGFTAQIADACVVVPTVNLKMVTAHTESFQLLLWHLIICHPKLMRAPMKWESTEVKHNIS
jgi:D-sedoheptulose 7-phosphate isomerase